MTPEADVRYKTLDDEWHDGGWLVAERDGVYAVLCFENKSAPDSVDIGFEIGLFREDEIELSPVDEAGLILEEAARQEVP
jgi:hypothetical protein